MSTHTEFFSLFRDGAVAHIAMNRPEKANGMTPEFWRELPKIMDELNSDETVRCAVITGQGKHFTGGMDLSAFGGIMDMAKQEPGRASLALRDLILKLQDSFTSIERARFPVIAAIHGACIGGGIDMITACDIRLASADAFFSVEEINIGMAADVGTLQRLPKLIAPSVAAELCYSGRRFSAEEAKGFGLVSTIAADREALFEEAFAQARAIAARSPLAIAGIKRNLVFSRDHSVADGLDYIATWNGGMLRAEDLMTAMQAKMAKKEGQFADLLSGKGSGF